MTIGFTQSEKQTEIMNVILKATDEGLMLDAKGVRDRVRYGGKVTVNAIISSLNFLVKHGFLVKKSREDRTRGLYWLPTKLAYSTFRVAPMSIRL
jgi:hypothetical protein